MKLILASTSPRRIELMALLGLPFEASPPNFLENSQEAYSPEHEALHFAREKALSLRGRFPDALIVGSDTIVALGETKLGKPLNPQDAKRMLRLLAGKTHRVLTGLVVLDAISGALRETVSQTQVRMKSLSDAEIEAYVASGEPMDKAGAYAVQGLGGKLIEELNGDFYTVVGLPINDLVLCLAHFGMQAPNREFPKKII